MLWLGRIYEPIPLTSRPNHRVLESKYLPCSCPTLTPSTRADRSDVSVGRAIQPGQSSYPLKIEGYAFSRWPSQLRPYLYKYVGYPPSDADMQEAPAGRSTSGTSNRLLDRREDQVIISGAQRSQHATLFMVGAISFVGGVDLRVHAFH